MVSVRLPVSETALRDAGARVLHYSAPLERAGEAAASLGSPAELDHRPGALRVSILEAEGLAARPDGSPCEPYVTVSAAELLRRRTRRTRACVRGKDVTWGESFEFDGVSACSQIVIDVWDRPAGGGAADLLGKAVLGLEECRPGVPHTYFKHLLEGRIALRILFDFDPLPPDEQLDGLEMKRSLQSLQAVAATGGA